MRSLLTSSPCAKSAPKDAPGRLPSRPPAPAAPSRPARRAGREGAAGAGGRLGRRPGASFGADFAQGDDVSNDLIRVLETALEKKQVLTRASELLCYAYDATAGVEGRVPDVVVLPASTDEVARVVRIARDAGAPVYPRGAGTSLSGGAIPARGGIVLSTAGMDAVLELDVENQCAIVQPGVVIQRLNDMAAGHGLMYPPDPGSVAVATMGGSIAECAGGLRGLKYGVTKHYVTGLEVVLADGQVVRL